MPRGKIIVIDGGDGSGKTVQTELLVKRLEKEGQKVSTLSFPRYEKPSGEKVKAYLNGALGDPTTVPAREASILYAYDRWMAMLDGDFDALEDGTHLVLNRYVASNMGHQGSKLASAEARANFFRWNDRFEHEFLGIPRPDLNVILHVPAEVSLELIKKRGEAMDGHENLAHLRQAEATYLELAESFERFALVECLPEGVVPTLDKLMSVEEIHERIWPHVAELCGIM